MSLPEKTYPRRADVVIIGAGISGASIAWNLARDSKLDVVVLDAGPKASGSTARSAAAFRHQFSSLSAIEMSLISGREYRTFSKTFGVEEVFSQNGYLFLWSGKDDMEAAEARVRFQRERGVPDVESLKPDQVRAKFPWIDHPEMKGASWCPHDGFLKPDLIATTYLDAAIKHGRTLLQYSEVTGIEVSGGEVKALIVKGQHRIEAGIVVNAAGPWSNAVAKLAGLQIPVTPVKRYLYFTNQLKGEGVPGWPLTVLDLDVYGRPEHEGLMMGWDAKPLKPEGWNKFPPPVLDVSTLNDRIEPGFGTGPDDYGFEVLMRMAEWVPAVAEKAGLDHATCGYYEVSPDEKAILSWDPRVKGLLHATGFSGHGVMHAPATGRIVADLILGRPCPIDVKALSIEPLLRNAERDDPEKMVI